MQSIDLDSALSSVLQVTWSTIFPLRAWNVLYHVGGNGPWIEKVDGVVDEGIEPPNGCSIEQIHMVSAHFSRRLGLEI